MDRLIAGLLLAGTLVSCVPAGKAGFDAWDSAFVHRPAGFGSAVTALWIATYQEDTAGHFTRTTAWGEVPEKLVPGDGGYTVAVPLLMQSETSDGPLPDRFVTVLVRVAQAAGRFSLVPNDLLPGTRAGWTDAGNRTVWFRGRTAPGESPQVLWQFKGRY